MRSIAGVLKFEKERDYVPFTFFLNNGFKSYILKPLMISQRV